MSTRQVPSAGSFLTGIRVLELADELGEYCGKVLAGLGADVIKVEPPGGERTRQYGPFLGDVPKPDRSLYFWHYNFGKRGITLDLDAAPQQDAFRRLAAGADVIIDTRPRSYLDSRGVGFGELRQLNPALIYARISPFGDDGPWADYKGCDLVHLALGGVVMNCGYDPTPLGDYDTPPVAPQMWQSYHIAGETTAMAVVAALCYRLASGSGQQLSTSVHDAVAKNTETDLPDWIYRRLPHHRLTCRHSFPPALDGEEQPLMPHIVAAKDGRWVLPYQTYLPGSGSPVSSSLAMLREHGLAGEVTRAGLDDPASLDPGDVARRIDALTSRLVTSYRFSGDLWLEAQARGLAWAPLRRPEENVADPHWSARETFLTVEHPELGMSVVEVGARWLAPGLPWRHGPRAPLVGEHSAQILAETRPGGRERPQPQPGRSDPSPGVPGVSPWGKPWALAGVRVIDLGWILASAGAGRFLAAHGAEVIKVEHVSRLDAMRRGGAMAPAGLRAERDAARGPLAAPATGSLNRSGYFMEINAGKRAISLNLKTSKGKEILRRLIREADILVEGYSPGTLDRMGLGYEALRQINPRLVYVQQSGMGQAGSYGRVKTFGPTAQAMSGISEMSGLAEPYPPAGIGYSYLDWFGAYQAALAMLAGLYRQRTTGRGCWIDSSQVEAGIYLTGTAVLEHGANGRQWQRYGNRSPYKPAAPHGVYPVSGADRWIAIGAFDDREWRSLAKVLDEPEWAGNPRFATLPRRLASQDVLDVLVAERTSQRDGLELMAALQAEGVPAGICQTAEDRCERDPQLRHLGWLTELRQSEIGWWPTKTPPVRFGETPPHQGGLVGRHGPSYGEDNEYVFGTVLGMTPGQIADLARDGVI